jgi:hypothetical protein
MTYDDLTEAQKELHDKLSVSAGWSGANLRDLMLESDAPDGDKAAVAEVFGGLGAGAEFLR